ncbi:hypothetical protein BGX26_010408 [Mortierella sp. AD094]|nr:hypothetical protein BGX26_010408 [Mortierella sp. AD094]
MKKSTCMKKKTLFRRCQYDQETSRLFYIDTATGKRQWEHPNGTEAGASDSAQFREQMDIYEESVARYNRTYGVGAGAGAGSPQMSKQFSHGRNPLERDSGKGERSSIVEPISSNNNEGGTSRGIREMSNTADDGVAELTASAFLLGDDDDENGGNQVPYEYERKYKATDLSNDDDGGSFFGGNNGFGGGAAYNYIDHNNNNHNSSSEGRFIGSGRNNQASFLDLSDNRGGNGNFFKERSANDDFFDRSNSGW